MELGVKLSSHPWLRMICGLKNNTACESCRVRPIQCVSVRWTKPCYAMTGPRLACTACSMVRLLTLLMLLEKLLVIRGSLGGNAK